MRTLAHPCPFLPAIAKEGIATSNSNKKSLTLHVVAHESIKALRIKNSFPSRFPASPTSPDHQHCLTIIVLQLHVLGNRTQSTSILRERNRAQVGQRRRVIVRMIDGVCAVSAVASSDLGPV